MTAIAVLSLLQKLEVPLFLTKDVADLCRIPVDATSKHLETLRRQNFIVRIAKGKWIVKNSALDPLQIAEFITAPKESYISLHTALFYHGMIEQVPARIYSVTIDRSKVVNTPFGNYSFHHCNPEFFTGYEFVKPYLNLAQPEKALVDYFYFAPTKSREFTKLPELEIPKKFSWRRALDYCDKIPSRRTRSMVADKLKKLSDQKLVIHGTK